MPRGVSVSLVTVALWAVWDIVARYGVTQLGVEPAVYVAYAHIAAALVLLLFAAPTSADWRTLRAPETWIFGLLTLALDVAFVTSVVFVTNTEANFLFRLSIAFSLLAAWWMLGRKPSLTDAIGSLVIIAGALVIAAGFDPDVRLAAIVAIGIGAVLQSLLTLLAETHPTVHANPSWRARAFQTGLVLMATSLLFLGVAVGGALLAQVFVEAPGAGVLRNIFGGEASGLSAFSHGPTIVLGILAGIFILSLATVGYFVAAKVATTEVFAMVAAALPVMTLVLEWSAAQAGLLTIDGLSARDLIAGAVILAAAVTMLVRRQMVEHRARRRGLGASGATF